MNSLKRRVRWLSSAISSSSPPPSSSSSLSSSSSSSHSRYLESTRFRGRRRHDPPVRRPSEKDSASLNTWDAAVQVIKKGAPTHLQHSGLRIALLIDAENITFRNVDGIINEVEKLGIVQIRRIYADWTSEVMRGWRQTVLTNALTPVHQFQSSIGKGNTDSMMIIDAMDLLYKNKDIESFCIVSSDADFTRLATKLREEGKLVLGIGSNLTPAPFVVSCNRFVYLHNLMKEDVDQQQQQQPQQTSLPPQQQQLQSQQQPALNRLSPTTTSSSQTMLSQKSIPSKTSTSNSSSPKTTSMQSMQQQKQSPIKQNPVASTEQHKVNTEKLRSTLPWLTRAWAAYRTDSGWAPLAGVANETFRLIPDFSIGSFGPFSKLEDLLEATDVFEVRKSSGSSSIQVRRVVSKNLETQSTTSAPPSS